MLPKDIYSNKYAKLKNIDISKIYYFHYDQYLL